MGVGALHAAHVAAPPNAVIFGGQLTYVADNGDNLYETYVAGGSLELRGDQLCALVVVSRGTITFDASDRSR